VNKYFKPKSLSWWSAVVPLAAGLVVATEPLHGVGSIVQTIDSVTGHVSPAMLINAGLVGIGFRGAIGQ
tara:strand:- start:1359 stop:1565 length:207 start_codon:yes stop_codon:yes gene_type:complete